MKITPVLFVDAIEPGLPFWVDKLGFTKTVEVPGEGGLAFVILVKDQLEIMMQTRASLKADLPGVAEAAGATFLYIEVADFEETKRKLDGLEVLIPERVAFYGMREIGVKDPAGNLLCFASPAPPSQP